jgi:hypothetical protein
MPLLYKNGKPTSRRKPGEAWPCEWCGAMLAPRTKPDVWNPLWDDGTIADDQVRYATWSPIGDREGFEGDNNVILVRLCRECSDIVWLLGNDHIRELPDD